MDDLLARIDAYRRQYLMEESTFGRLAINDGNLIKELRAGTRKLRLLTLDRIESVLAKHPDVVRAERAAKAEAAE